jgi:hypothetical protein
MGQDAASLPRAGGVLRARGVQRTEDRPQRFLGELARQPHHHVVQRGQVGEQAQILEGARDAGVHHRLRRQPVERTAAECYASLVGLQEAGDHVEDRCLAGAVRPDQAGDAPLRDGEAAILQASRPPKRFLQPDDLKIGAHSRSPANLAGGTA